MPKKIIDLENRSITITFDDETSRTFGLTDLNDEMRLALTLHGLSQKLGDSYAGANKDERPNAYAQAQVDSVWSALVEGKFRQAVAGGAGPRITMLVEALARATGHDTDKASEVVENMSDEEKKALRKHPAVKSALEAIKAERAIAASKKAAAETSEIDLASLIG